MTRNFNFRLTSLISFFLIGAAVAFAFSQLLWISILCLSTALMIRIISQDSINQLSLQQQTQKSETKKVAPEFLRPDLTTDSEIVSSAATERGRVMIFVDADNIHFSGRGEDNNIYVFYEKMVDRLFLGASTKVDARFYYNNDPKLENVITTMQAAGFTIVRPSIRPDDCEARPTDLDPEIIRDLDEYKDSYDTGVLVSGDKHFLGSIKKLISQGKRIEVVGFDATTNRGLKRFCSQYIDIESLEGVYEVRPFKKREVEKPVLKKKDQ